MAEIDPFLDTEKRLVMEAFQEGYVEKYSKEFQKKCEKSYANLLKSEPKMSPVDAAFGALSAQISVIEAIARSQLAIQQHMTKVVFGWLTDPSLENATAELRKLRYKDISRSD